MVSFTSEILIENTQPRPALAPAKPDDQDHKMRCLEVWGGNTPVDNGVVMPGLDAWVYSRPHNGSEHGGDVYYVSSCVCGYMTRLLLADVSGHGESAAKEANKLRYLMRKHVNSCDQSAFVSKLNNAFSGVSDGAGFATAVAATYLAVENILIVCNAGQPAPLWYRAKTDTWQQLDLDAAMRALNEEDDPSNRKSVV